MVDKEFSKTIFAKMPGDEKTVGLAMAKAGYRQVSRKFGIASRVDIPIPEMVDFFVEQNFGNRNSGVPCCSIKSQKEHYRRCYSKDSIVDVPDNVMKWIRQYP